MWQILTPGHRSTGDGLSSIVAIVIGATAGTILLSICAIGLLCVKGCCSESSFRNTGKRFLTGVDNLLYSMILITPFYRSIAIIHTSTNKA